jgi:flagellar hook-associated protein 3 FlgL
VADQRTVAENDPGSRAFMNIRDGNGVFSVGAAPANTGTAWFAGAAVTDRSQWVAGDYRVEFTAPGSYQVRDAGGALVAGGAYTPGTPIAFRGVAVTIDGAPAAGDRFEVSESRNQSIFASLQELVDALALDATQPAGRARLQSALNAGLDNLDQALDNIARVRSDVGTRLAAIESQQDVNADLELDLSQSLSDLRDVDLAAAVSALEQQLAALEAAQKSFARTQSLSLFDLI